MLFCKTLAAIEVGYG